MDEMVSHSFVEREEQFQDRWTTFGKQSGILKIYKRLSARKLQEFEIFKDYKADFLEKISPDVCVAVWEKGKIVFEEGAYLDLAFFVLNGNVNLYIKKQQVLGRKGGAAGNVRSRNTPDPSVFQSQIKELKENPGFTFLSSMDIDMPWGGTINVKENDLFGEVGASVGWPQSVTAQTMTQCALLQIRAPALEAMKRKSPALRTRLNKIYVERSLSDQLKNTPLFQVCSEEFIDDFKQRVELKSYDRGEVIVREGEPVDAIFLVRAGFVKLSQQVGAGELVVNYLSKGKLLGDSEFVMKLEQWQHTVRSVEHTELVRIDKSDFNLLIEKHPKLQRSVWDSSAKRTKEAGRTRKNPIRSEFLETALESGLVEGTSVLVIDLDACTRCDDCVRGCGDTHDQLPRFVREGEKYYNFLITRSCYHCQDPVCLIGCPTGAIRRAGIGDVVEIDDELCIGCKTCYHKCPYDAITMIDTEEYWSGQYAQPRRVRPEISEMATKCDLCYDTGHTPACVANCPQGCATRVDTVDHFAQLISNSERRQQVWRTFSLKNMGDFFPTLRALLLTGVFLAAIYLFAAYTFGVDAGNIWGLSYGTGAAVLMVGVALYGVRRRKMKLARKFAIGKARAWLQFHLYGGFLFLMLMFMHSGFTIPTGAFYLWLWGLSIWVSATGVVGLILQKWLPKVLSSGLNIEVIYERIPQLSKELNKNADALVADCSQLVKDFYLKRILPSLKKPTLRLIYFFDITGGIQRRMRQFDFFKKLLPEDELNKVNELQLIYKSKLEMDAQYTLQRLLRIWLPLHLPASILLLVLLCVHLYVVFYY